MGEAEAIAAAPASPRKPSGMFSYLLLIVFTFILLYVICVGPAVWVYYHNRGTPVARVIETIYTPLFEVCASNEFAEDSLMKYVGLWVELD